MKTNEKIKAILNARTPTNVHEVKSFLGLVQFYGKFCQNLATMAYPLNNLTKKDSSWNWSKECQESFEKIKNEICSERILIHYDPQLPLILATDASPVGIGAVLSHRLPNGTERPIAFASRTLTKTEQHYSQIDKEALSISWGLKKFYLYLKGRRFILLTDHKPLVSIFGSKKGIPILSATRLLHYALQLQSFQFDIQYRNTREHGNADCLSRLPMKSEDLDIKDDIAIFQLSQIETLPITAKELAKETERDEDLRVLLQILQSGGQLKGKEAEHSLQDGCIMYGNRVCIPKRYQYKVLQELHYGHLGIVKMKAIARSYVYWKNIDKDIEKIANDCMECSQHKTNPPKSKVHYWEYPSTPWERIHIDFAGPMFGHMFLIIVDAHSKWMEVYILKSTMTTITIDCLRDCFARYGLPVSLVSDNGSQFTSKEFENFLTNNGIKHKTCAPFNPSSNGQAERYVFTLKQSLCAMINYPGNLHKKLNIFLMQYRKAPNITMQQSPSMLFMKRDIRTRIDLLRPNTKNRIQEQLRKNTYIFRDRIFYVGDKVAVRIYNSPNSKWAYGTVINKDGALHYTVDVKGTLIRRHVDQMRQSPNCQDDKERDEESKETDENESAPEGFTIIPGVLSEDLKEQDEISGSANVNDNMMYDHQMSEEAQTGSNQSPARRRSNRIRRAPERLNL